jgi:hypothetical protein
LDTQADFLLHIGSTAVLSNGVGTLPLSLQSGAGLDQVEMVFHVSGSRLANLHLTNLAAQVGSVNLVPLGADRYRVQFNRRGGDYLQGNFVLARLGFSVLPDAHSAVATLRGESLTAVRADAQAANGRAGVGRVFIVGQEPILDLARTNGQVALTLYALPGQTVAIERAAVLGGVGAWTFDSSVTATGLRTDLPPRSATGPVEFFRAKIGGTPPTLTVRFEGGQIILEWPLDCIGCDLFQSPSIGPDAAWTPVLASPQVVNGRYRVALPPPNHPLFLRLGRSGALSIRAEGGQAVIEWSLGCAGCTLLQSPSVGPDAVWTPSVAQPQVVNDRYRVVLPISGQRQFLRLAVP